MDTQNNYIDNKLKDLSGYEPSVKPDWESFYIKNQEEIGKLAGAKHHGAFLRIIRSSLFRNSIILFSVIGIIATTYFFLDESEESSGTNQNPAQHEQPQIIEDQSGEINNQDIQVFDEKGAINTDKPNTEPARQQPELPVGQIENQTDQSANQLKSMTTDSVANNTVIIKKTIILQDTIRVKKPIRK